MWRVEASGFLLGITATRELSSLWWPASINAFCVGMQHVERVLVRQRFAYRRGVHHSCVCFRAGN
jgi:hypothetical protein